MSISSLNMYTPMRITGISSGMDTDSMVQDMLQIEQYKLDEIYKAQTREEWKVEAYEDINDALTEFTNKYMSALSEDNMWTTSVYKGYETNLESNKYISATATGDAFSADFNIVAATKAQYASISSDGYVSRNTVNGYAGMNSKLQYTMGDVGTDNKTLAQLEAEGDNVSFSINGATFAFDSTQTVDEVIAEINAKSDQTGVSASISSEGKLLLSTESYGEVKLETSVISGGDVFGLTSSADPPTRIDGINTTEDTLGDLVGQYQMFGDGDTLKFSINGENFEFDRETKVQDVIDAVNAKSADTGVTMIYSVADDRFTLANTDANKGKEIRLENVEGEFFNADGPIGIGEESPGVKTYDTVERAAEKMGLELVDDKLEFTINGETFSFDADEKLSDMIADVNGNGDAGVVMSYSEITDSFSIRSASTGASEAVNFEGGAVTDDTKNFFGFALDAEGSIADKGDDASITFKTEDGNLETISRAENTFTVDGVELTIKEGFDSTATGATDEAVSFSVSLDNDPVMDKVLGFVEEYNKIIEMLNGMINQEVEYDYDVLTQEEQEGLSEEELEDWNSKAKSGTLRNDDYIAGLLYEMRSFLYEEVGDTGLTPADIGLKTGSYDKNGQIDLSNPENMELLEEALLKSPDLVAEVMAGVKTDADGEIDMEGSGLITRFYETINNYESNIKENVLTNANSRIDDYEEEYENQVLELYEMSERYYQQFATMETLLSQYDAQSQWLTQQLGM